jgi:hypothetical protein
LSSADVYILYRVLLCIHSLPQWDILILGGQLSLHIVCTVGIYFQCLVSIFFFLKQFVLIAWSWTAIMTLYIVIIIIIIISGCLFINAVIVTD